MNGTGGLPRACWLHCTCRARVCECRSYKFGWLFNRDTADQGHDTVIDVRDRVYTLPPGFARVA